MARKKKHEEHLNHEAWAIPYGDLITLLLAFFVVMYAVSSVNEGKYRVLSDSLVAAFRGQPMTMQPVQVGQKQLGSGADLSMSLVQQDMLTGQPREMFARPAIGHGAGSGRSEAARVGCRPVDEPRAAGHADRPAARDVRAAAAQADRGRARPRRVPVAVAVPARRAGQGAGQSRCGGRGGR